MTSDTIVYNDDENYSSCENQIPHSSKSIVYNLNSRKSTDDYQQQQQHQQHQDKYNDSIFTHKDDNTTPSFTNNNRNSIESKLNKLIWITVGILLLIILSIVLFWSLVITCYFCMDIYYYIKTNQQLPDPSCFFYQNNNTNDTILELPENK